MTKEKLMATGCFIENEYLDSYLTLVNNTENITATELHHIIPKSYFKSLGIEVDNSSQNLVRLTYADHCKAHWLLYHCTLGRLKKASEAAYIILTKSFLKVSSIEQQIDYKELQTNWLKFKNNDQTILFTVEEEKFIIENYGKISIKQIAKKLNRSNKSIIQKATLLGLRTKQPNFWSEEEQQYLKDNYGKKSLVEISEALGRSYSTVVKLSEQLETHTERNYWSNKELEFIKANYKTLGRFGCAKALNRTARAVQLKASNLGVYQDYGINVYCVELDKSWPSMKAAADELHISVTLIERCLSGKQKQTHGYHFRKN